MMNLKISLISYCQNISASLENGLVMIKKLRKSLDSGGLQLTDLSKALDCLPHDCRINCKAACLRYQKSV